MMEKPPESLNDIAHVHAELMHILEAIMQMGASDNSEKEKMEDIMKKLREKQISPKQALVEGRALLYSKQDYH